MYFFHTGLSLAIAMEEVIRVFNVDFKTILAIPPTEEQIEAIPQLWSQCTDVPCPPMFQDRVRVLEENFFGVISSQP